MDVSQSTESAGRLFIFFFIKINCVAEAAYLSVPPADTCPPPTAVCAHVCVCVCVSMPSNNGSVVRHRRGHTNESERNTDRKKKKKISMFPREQTASSVPKYKEGNLVFLFFCKSNARIKLILKHCMSVMQLQRIVHYY